jgi:hypothetical protein
MSNSKINLKVINLTHSCHKDMTIEIIPVDRLIITDYKIIITLSVLQALLSYNKNG